MTYEFKPYIMSRYIEVAKLEIILMYAAIGKYWQMSLIEIFGFWCQSDNTVPPSINLDDGGRNPNIHGKHCSISFPRIGSYFLHYDGCLY